MIAIHARLAAQAPPGAARLVLQIHDEFLLEVAGGWAAPLPSFVCFAQLWFRRGPCARRARRPPRCAHTPSPLSPLIPPPPPADHLVEPVARLVRECMEGCAADVRLRVPLRVRLAAGPSWGTLSELRLAP